MPFETEIGHEWMGSHVILIQLEPRNQLYPSSLPTQRFDSNVVHEMSAVFIVTRKGGGGESFFGEDGGSF